jgi:hypothetical protein
MTTKEIYHELRKPLALQFISWKPNVFNRDRTRAQITFHIDARAVQHKLNESLGIDGWNFTFVPGRDAGIYGRLVVRINDREVIREDVGYPQNPDKDDRDKDAVSDALKRCAVHFGVGHFLYALPDKWVDWNPEQRGLTDSQNDEIRKWLDQVLVRLHEQLEPSRPRKVA